MITSMKHNYGGCVKRLPFVCFNYIDKMAITKTFLVFDLICNHQIINTWQFEIVIDNVHACLPT